MSHMSVRAMVNGEKQDLSELKTETKQNLVEAINELVTKYKPFDEVVIIDLAILLNGLLAD